MTQSAPPLNLQARGSYQLAPGQAARTPQHDFVTRSAAASARLATQTAAPSISLVMPRPLFSSRLHLSSSCRSPPMPPGGNWQPLAPDWRRADWSSAELLPAAGIEPDATVHVFAARVGRWRGVFAHHSWVVVKERDASAYTRFDVVGWGNPVRVNHRDADGRWYGNVPEVVGGAAGRGGGSADPAHPRGRDELRLQQQRAAIRLAGAELEQLRPAYPGRGAGARPAPCRRPRSARTGARTASIAGLTPSRTGLQASLYGAGRHHPRLGRRRRDQPARAGRRLRPATARR